MNAWDFCDEDPKEVETKNTMFEEMFDIKKKDKKLTRQ